MERTFFIIFIPTSSSSINLTLERSKHFATSSSNSCSFSFNIWGGSQQEFSKSPSDRISCLAHPHKMTRRKKLRKFDAEFCLANHFLCGLSVSGVSNSASLIGRDQQFSSLPLSLKINFLSQGESKVEQNLKLFHSFSSFNRKEEFKFELFLCNFWGRTNCEITVNEIISRDARLRAQHVSDD